MSVNFLKAKKAGRPIVKQYEMGIYPLEGDEMKSDVFEFLPELFLRAPFYSYQKFNLDDLPKVLQEQHFQNAIWLASPVFYGLIKAKGFNFEQLNDKEIHTLGKYFNRMCYRPTPFGSFASITNLNWSEDKSISLENDRRAILHLLPDRDLSTLKFQAKRSFSADTLVIKNPTIYLVGEFIRFFHTVLGPKGRFRFTIDQIDAVDFNLDLLKELHKGGVRAGDIESWISKNADCTMAEANDYLRFLIEDQVLYTQDQGQVITRHTATGRQMPGFWQYWRSHCLKDVGQLSATNDELASCFSVQQGVVPKAFYYATLERPVLTGGLSKALQDQLSEAIKVLQKLAIPAPLDALENFIKGFQAKFDLQKVPLLHAIDPDTGVYYGDRITLATSQNLLENIRFPDIPKKQVVPWGNIKQFFLKLWLNNHRRDFYEAIVIEDDDLTGLTTDHLCQHPPTAAVMFRKSGDQLIIDSAGGSSATQLIGRFSAINEKTWELCRKVALIEQNTNPEVVFADISQISDSYLDNINQRRPIYPFEIPLNVYSDLPAAQQLLPEDLLVSVRSGELILESRHLGKRVIPRLASAYNYHHNELPLFQLLGDLQFQSLNANLNLDLALIFPGLAYYPRIVYRQIILSAAKWFLTLSEIKELQQCLMAEDTEEINKFRKKLALPPLICLGRHDQQLTFDLENKENKLFLSQWLKDKKELTIKEYLLSDDAVICQGQPLAGQFISFIKQNNPVYKPLYRDTHQPKNKTRKFRPGDDWLYIKLYCTPVSANILLEKLIYPVIQKYQVRILSWFFVRYSDPGHHIRLRIRIKGTDIGQILIALKNQIKKQRLAEFIGEFNLDTYLREVERYGSGYIIQAENVFFAGSNLAAKFFFLKLYKKDVLGEFRLAMITAYELIHSFYQNRSQMTSFAAEVSESFLNEFQADKNLKIDLDQKFRLIKAQIGDWISNKEAVVNDLGIAMAYDDLIFQSKKMSGMIPKGQPTAKKRMLADLVHMQMNRTFTSAQRQQELLVYYCLNKYLTSEVAKSKKLLRRGDPVC